MNYLMNYLMNYAIVHETEKRKFPPLFSSNYILSKRITKKARPGFTFFELLLVITILGGLMAFISSKVIQYQKQSKVGTAKLGLRTLHEAINMYNTDTGQYPTTLVDLVQKPADVKNWSSAYTTKKALTDPWGNKYKYEPTPEATNGRPYQLFSYGPQGRKASKNDYIDVWDEQ